MSSANGNLIITANKLIVDAGDFDQVTNYFSEDYTVHVTGRSYEGGHKLVKKTIGDLRTTFSDLATEIEILLVHESRVAWQRTYTGIQVRAYKGFPATNKTMTWQDMVVSHIESGLIREEWLVTDLAEQLLRARKK